MVTIRSGYCLFVLVFVCFVFFLFLFVLVFCLFVFVFFLFLDVKTMNINSQPLCPDPFFSVWNPASQQATHKHAGSWRVLPALSMWCFLDPLLLGERSMFC